MQIICYMIENINNKKTPARLSGSKLRGDPSATRTRDTLIKSQVLWPSAAFQNQWLLQVKAIKKPSFLARG